MTNPEINFSQLDAFLRSETAHPEIKKTMETANSAGTSWTQPRMPEKSGKGSGDESLFWRSLREFYRNGRAEGKGNLYPALLAPYRDMHRVQHDFPVWIADTDAFDGDHVLSLSLLLDQATKAFAPDPLDAKILKDNLPRLELLIRDTLTATTAPFRTVCRSAIERLRSSLHLKGADADNLAADFDKLLLRLPETGSLAPFSGDVGLLILAAAIRVHHRAAQEYLSRESLRLKQQLDSLLQVERLKRPEALAPAALSDNYGYGGAFINFNKFSEVMPESPSLPMPADRFERIEKAVHVLEKAGSFLREDSVIVIGADVDGMETDRWTQIFPSSMIFFAEKHKSCAEAQRAFDGHMKAMTELIRALRIARLESEGRYDASVHDGYFAHFDWKAFSGEEMNLSPPVIMMASASELIGHGLTELSGMLSSHRPIKQVVFHREDTSGETGFNQELGALAIAHRNTFVLQTTPIHPDRLWDKFLRGLTDHAPAMFYILFPPEDPETNAFIKAGAALESRTFPEFCYDPQLGAAWGSRFDVDSNPQSDQDWPAYAMEYLSGGRTDTLTVSFTYADAAAIQKRFESQFMDVPPSFWNEDLVPYSEFLELSATEAYTKIPFVWMIDTDGTLHKVAVSHAIVRAGQERLDFWHFIQDLGGINSYHVERAVEKTRTQLAEEHAAEIQRMNEAHRIEIDRVRESSAREAMENLSSVLLDLDTLPVRVTDKAVSTMSTAKETPPTSVAETAVAEEAPVLSTEPWLDTIRCTSCNECININPNLFKYNSAKQALIGDARAGSYAQIVRAAEKCPAKCIHPGMPLNSAEEGLESLIKRAEPFN